MKQSYDFTAGPIGRPLLLYTLPLLLANVLQSFYQLVDLLVVGRIVGETGLAAISSASASPSRPAPRTPPAWRKPRGPFSPLPWSSPFWWLWQGP